MLILLQTSYHLQNFPTFTSGRIIIFWLHHSKTISKLNAFIMFFVSENYLLHFLFLRSHLMFQPLFLILGFWSWTTYNTELFRDYAEHLGTKGFMLILRGPNLELKWKKDQWILSRSTVLCTTITLLHLQKCFHLVKLNPYKQTLKIAIFTYALEINIFMFFMETSNLYIP